MDAKSWTNLTVTPWASARAVPAPTSTVPLPLHEGYVSWRETANFSVAAEQSCLQLWCSAI
ncbi:hypothetical protein PV664_37075 [Streptomyces sp. ME01-18a]|uniref:hypothetical protein n=1 Tax=Streptomyces sp. ME01-18a TaxID=3028669 RepID=UPI0029BA1119|nr:hypothetical protein [Streptomyces sp. ME01-18a]MDX3434409.1 hypothetical protein [Streptomyces sp. ME01-18a]